MSLLRSVLKKNNEKREAAPFDPGKPSGNGGGKKNYARSFASSSMSSIRTASAASFKSVATTIASMVSFYSFITGGPKIPKRRRPDYLTFGTPSFWFRRPPPSVLPPGVERIPPSTRPFTAAHSAPCILDGTKGEPELCVILYSHAKPSEPRALYHDQGVVSGEVRVFLKKPKAFDRADLWFTAKMDCNLEIQGPAIIHQKAEIYVGNNGSLLEAAQQSNMMNLKSSLFGKKDKLPAGTHIFPFSFEVIPQEIQIRLNEEAERKNKGLTRIDLPASYSTSMVDFSALVKRLQTQVRPTRGFSGQCQYDIGLNIEYTGVMAVDDIIDMPIFYLPRTRPIPRPAPSLPPIFPTREDWPYSREEIGGWTITPFGGRGRWDDEITEIEGLFGTPYPPIYSNKETVPVSLILWSTNAEALEALAQPESIALHFARNEVYGPDSLAPRTASRRNRKVTSLNIGKMWRVEEDSVPPSPVTAVSDDGGSDDVETVVDEGTSGAIESDAPAVEVDDETAREDLFVTPSPISPPLGVPPSTTPSESSVTPPSAETPSNTVEDTSNEAGGQEGSSGTISASTPPSADADQPPPPIRLHLDGPIRLGPKPRGAATLSTPSPSVPSAKHVTKPPRRSPLARVAASAVPEEPVVLSNDADPETPTSPDGERPPSPTPSNEEIPGEDAEQFPGEEEKGMVIQLRGEVQVLHAAGVPSFNYKYMSRNYMLKLIITHPRYLHISPNATGPYAESAVWVTTHPVDPSRPVPDHIEWPTSSEAKDPNAKDSVKPASNDSGSDKVESTKEEESTDDAEEDEAADEEDLSSPTSAEIEEPLSEKIAAAVPATETPEAESDALEPAPLDLKPPSEAPTERTIPVADFVPSPNEVSSPSISADTSLTSSVEPGSPAAPISPAAALAKNYVATEASRSSSSLATSTTPSLAGSSAHLLLARKSSSSIHSSASSTSASITSTSSTDVIPKPKKPSRNILTLLVADTTSNYPPPRSEFRPVPDLSPYASLPITGECVPLPEQSEEAERQKLPLIRHDHTFGFHTRERRPIMAHRIDSI